MHSSQKVLAIVVSVVLLVSLAGALNAGLASASPASPSLDGKAAGSCGQCTSVTVTLSTSNTNDVIIVSAAYGSCPSIGVPSDTQGLAFHTRGSISNCGNLELVEYYAIATAALSSDKITCSSSSDSWISCIAFGISGGNTASPFDSASPTYPTADSSCPQTSQLSYPCVDGLSTTHADDFVFDLATDTGGQTQSAGSGFTLIGDTTTGQDGYVQYKVAPTTLTSDLEPFGTAIPFDFLAIGDAVQPSAAASSAATASSTTTSTHTTTSATTSSTTATSTTSTTSTKASTTASSTTTSTSKTSSTSTTTSSTADSQSAGTGVSGGSTFYLGAMSEGSSSEPNTGARSSIQVEAFDVPVGCVAFWIADASSSNLWMQAGYYICNGDVPVAFTQVWNLNSRAMLYSATLSSVPSSGVHQFAVTLESGTTWEATMDGQVIGSYNLGSASSSTTYPVYALSEETLLALPISIPAISFPVAIQVQMNGAWSDPTITAYNYGANWGLEGAVQNSALSADSIIIGGGLSTPANNSPL